MATRNPAIFPHQQLIQEISNGRTYWTDPEKTWVSNTSIATSWTGSFGIRSHLIFDAVEGKVGSFKSHDFSTGLLARNPT